MALPSTPPTSRSSRSSLGSSVGGHSTNIIVAGKSEVVCKPILESLKTMAGAEVVAQPVTGSLVPGRLRQGHVDVVVMDIGMPEIDGLRAIPNMLKVDPDLKIIMVATLTFRNVKIIMDGLVAGAVEIVT
ncbi:MAG: response regulator, partial [Rhodospirillales bacterium]|nr:response regulator [Rhodospirillales bacterium]